VYLVRNSGSRSREGRKLGKLVPKRHTARNLKSSRRLGLSAMKRRTSYAPLAALGYILHQRNFFAPLREHIRLGGKTILHELHQKLLDVVVSMLADYASLRQINTRLRPDTALGEAWGRAVFADQSTVT
jgi:hypothetical protein